MIYSKWLLVFVKSSLGTGKFPNSLDAQSVLGAKLTIVIGEYCSVDCLNVLII